MEITITMIVGLGLGFAMGHYWAKSNPKVKRPRMALSAFVQQERVCGNCGERDPTEAYLWTYIGNSEGVQRLSNAAMAFALNRFSSLSRARAISIYTDALEVMFEHEPAGHCEQE